MSPTYFAFTSMKRKGDEGRNPSFDVTTVSVARGNTEGSPMLVANEWICSKLAQHLLLPVPPFAIMRKQAGGTRRYFASLRFGGGEETPNDVNLDLLAKHLPYQSTGIVLFDILIANDDRHRGNIKVDRPDSPRQVVIYDHDRACSVASSKERPFG